MRFRTLRYAGIGLAMVLLSGCAGEPPVGRPPEGPLGLVGMWQVVTPGEPRAYLRLGDDLAVWSHCGAQGGAWSADASGLFTGGNALPSCEGGPTWLLDAVRYRREGVGWALEDLRGRVTAQLRPGGRPPASSTLADTYRDPPTITPSVRELLRTSGPLPPGLTPATRRQLVGQWVPQDAHAAVRERGPKLTLRDDGAWEGSDGCNFSSGRWTSDDHGAVRRA